jgi:hypothetical protein
VLEGLRDFYNKKNWRLPGLLSAWLLLRNRLVSPSFIVLFAFATNIYLLDVFLAAYSRNHLPPNIQSQVSDLLGHGMIVGVYLGSVFEALFISAIAGFLVSRIRNRKTGIC